MNSNIKKFFYISSILLLGLGALFFVSQKIATASTNISSAVTEHWGWNDVVGWIDFYNTNTVTVNSLRLTGYASSSIGNISFDCTTSPSGNICGTSNYAVYNDGLGGLTGFAWNDTYGWISFCGGQGTSDCPNNPGGTLYQTLVDRTNGTFQGTAGSFAWNDIIGWISFNCLNGNGGASICGTSDYKVISSWIAISATGTIDSVTFDTGVNGGAQINSVLWRGNQPAGTLVGFQFATSNSSSGSWNFIGPDNTGNTYYYPSAVNVSMPVNYTVHVNQRYFRYRATLFSDFAQRFSPRVDDVFVNWSP
jgi:hypothetical protein